jgi:hypothetical protein
MPFGPEAQPGMTHAIQQPTADNLNIIFPTVRRTSSTSPHQGNGTSRNEDISHAKGMEL